MRSAASTTLIRGRHRLGRPGLVYVTTFVAVVRRGLFESWRIPGRHRRVPAVDPRWTPAPVPVAPTASSIGSAAPAVPGAYAV